MKNTFKFILTADWHLRQASMGSNVRGEDFFRSARNVVNQAAKAGIGTILHGGDIVDATRLTSKVQNQLMHLDRYCIDNSITMFVVSGNHDMCEPHWIKTIEEFREKQAGPYGIKLVDNEVFRIGPTGLELVIAAYPSMDNQTFLSNLQNPDLKADVILWHGAIREFCGFPTPHQLSIDDLPLDRFKALLMGDIHVRKFITTASGCIVGYPGATDVVKKSDPLLTSCTVFCWDGKKLTESVELPVAHRTILARRIDTEETMDEVLAEIRKVAGTPHMFLVSYNSSLQNVSERLHIATSASDALLRCESYGVGSGVGSALAFAGMTSPLADESTRAPASFVHEVFPVDSDLAKVAVSLLDPDQDHQSIVRNFAQSLIS